MSQERSAIGEWGLSGAVLKWIAVLTMLIDHIGAALLEGLYVARGNSWGSGIFSLEFCALLRGVGRLAFPIFCFLLAEGLFHTRSRRKYLLRLVGFALISELPFDRAFFQSWWAVQHQNVFFTLSFGLSACAAWDWLEKRKRPNGFLLRGLAELLVAAAAVLGAQWIRSDYGGLGVILILVMYLFRDHSLARDLMGFGVLCLMVLIGASHWSEVLGALSFPLFHSYNGKRGRQPKYFFYVFYPAHLLFLYGLLTLLR